jgi:hypothetical protein
MITRRLYSNQTYCSSYFHAVEIAMAWYVVFHGQKPRVYDSRGVYSEYVVGFSGAAF